MQTIWKLSMIVVLSTLLMGCEKGGGSQSDTTTDLDDEDTSVTDDVLDDGDVLDGSDVPEDGFEDLDVLVEEEPDPEWERFMAARDGYLEQLSAPILECVILDDTENPAFHGCIDWHSAVEGALALHVLARVLGGSTYTDALVEMLPADAIAAELLQLETGGPIPVEIPYGYSWFLALAVERERAGHTDLMALADVVSTDLVDWVTGMTRTQIDGALRNDNYDNLSWVILNIWLHATTRGDDSMAVQMEDFTRNEILGREMLCPLSRSEYDVDEFFAPCMHRARLILTVLTDEEASTWAETGIPEGWGIDPLSVIETPHSGGLNFSRSWDFLDLYQATGDRSYRMMYIAHIETHMAMPDYWRDDYLYAHWVPQFGVYAIARSYE